MERREAIKRGVTAMALCGPVVRTVDVIPDEPDALCLVVKLDWAIDPGHSAILRKFFEGRLGLPVVVLPPGVDIRLMRKSDVERLGD